MTDFGRKQTNVSKNPDNDFEPAWSPEGKQIAFLSTRDGAREIYTMKDDGSNQANRTNSADHEDSPDWMVKPRRR